MLHLHTSHSSPSFKSALLRQLEAQPEHTGVILTFRTPDFIPDTLETATRILSKLREAVDSYRRGDNRLRGAIILNSSLIAADDSVGDRIAMRAEVKVLAFIWRRNVGTSVYEMNGPCPLRRHYEWRRDGARTPTPPKTVAEYAYVEIDRHSSIVYEVLSRSTTLALIEMHVIDPVQDADAPLGQDHGQPLGSRRSA